MRLQLTRPLFGSEPLLRFSHEQIVNEIGAFGAPAAFDFLGFDFDLLAEHLLLDFASVLSVVGPLAHHELEADDPDREKVDRKRVVLFPHHLGRHVPGRAAGFARVVGHVFFGDAEVRDAEIAVLVENQVFGFYVAVNDVLAVNVLQAVNHARDEKPRLLFAEPAIATYVITQITTV
jgi:hypothetical protein